MVRRFFRRLAELIARTGAKDLPDLVMQRYSGDPLVVPAQGGVFSFHVHATYTWRSQGLDEDSLDAWARYFAPHVRRRLRQRAAATARRHEPQQADEFEAALNAELPGPLWTHERDGAVLTCRVRAYVTLDEHVRERLKPLWEKLLELQFQHKVEMQRADLVDIRSQKWIGILETLRGPVAPGAARLTDPALADVVQQMADEQKKLIEELTGLLKDTTRGGGLGAYEAAQMMDMLTENLRQHTASAVPGSSGDWHYATSGEGRPTNGHRSGNDGGQP
ncbi:MAG TPA: hypothetical protein VES42_25900 [Pilimelia sp.]|nr:hypothetical protein [Pilimelia sp.]